MQIKEASLADYREISQEYAQGAIKAVILINGGAAVAVLSQFGHLAEILPGRSPAVAVLVFALGVALGVSVWLLAFLSTRHVDRAERGQDLDYSIADKFQAAGVIVLFLSLVAFLIGCAVLACPILSQ